MGFPFLSYLLIISSTKMYFLYRYLNLTLQDLSYLLAFSTIVNLELDVATP